MNRFALAAQKALARYALTGLLLTGREARVVASLARSPRGTLTREEIVREVWGTPVDTDDLRSRFHLVRVVIARARPKLATRGVCIGTLPSWGYRLHVMGDGPRCEQVQLAWHYVPLCCRGEA